MAEIQMISRSRAWTRRRAAGAIGGLAATVLAACRAQAPAAPSADTGGEQPVKAPSTNTTVVM
ncbi:MAG: hypothetical protein K6U88_07025, partial [Dehalococcoidia bacterium]|nr:hypothetical protein [Dehalococcoidia bacterium]